MILFILISLLQISNGPFPE